LVISKDGNKNTHRFFRNFIQHIPVKITALLQAKNTTPCRIDLQGPKNNLKKNPKTIIGVQKEV